MFELNPIWPNFILGHSSIKSCLMLAWVRLYCHKQCIGHSLHTNRTARNQNTTRIITHKATGMNLQYARICIQWIRNWQMNISVPILAWIIHTILKYWYQNIKYYFCLLSSLFWSMFEPSPTWLDFTFGQFFIWTGVNNYQIWLHRG